MKNIYVLVSLFFTLSTVSQTAYEDGMKKAFDLWDQEKITEAANLFERIAKAEKKNWIPYYYAGFVIIQSSFGEKDEANLESKLNKASDFLDEALLLSPNNPEILIAKALHNTSYISFDGQKYGMTMSGKNAAIYSKALKIAPKNPRVILSKAEWDMGSARFFGQSTKPYCDEIKKAIEIGKNENIEQKFYPKFLVIRAEEVLNKCEK